MVHPAEDSSIFKRIHLDVFGIIVIASSIVLGTLMYVRHTPLHPAPCTPEFYEFTVDITNSTTLDNGSLQADDLIYPPGTYWYLNGTTRGCPCHVKPCINKCCPPGESFTHSALTCRPHNKLSLFNNFTRKVYDYSGREVNISKNYFHIIYDNPCTNPNIIYWAKDGYFPYLMDDGRIVSVISLIFDHSHYCFETLDVSPSINVLFCMGQNTTHSVHIGDILKKIFFDYNLFYVSTLIPLAILLATALVYLALPELQTLQGKFIICYSISKILYYFIPLLYVLDLLHWATDNSCAVVFAADFFLLASYFWLHVICVDIWWIFSDLKPMKGALARKRSDVMKFRLYSVCAWGSPLLILIMVAIKRELIQLKDDNIIQPAYKYRWCVNYDGIAEVIIYLPICVLICVDNFLYFTTASRIRAHSKDTEQLNGKESRRHDVEGFSIYRKLEVIMGVNWLFLLLYFTTSEPLVDGWEHYVATMVVDIADMIQVVLFFYILVCKKRIINCLKARFTPVIQFLTKPWQTSNATSSNELQGSGQLERVRERT